MKLNIYDTPAETIKRLADYFVSACQACISRHNRFSVALSGGSSPKKLYELLASDDYKNSIDWHKVYFFFGDERYVPLIHKDSNYFMAKQALLAPLQIANDHIFPVDTTALPEEAARKYATTIEDFFGANDKRFDLILLGLGANCHTASLFPHTSILTDDEPDVKSLFIEEINATRITLNAPLINQAHHIAFLVYGKDKAEAVHHILKDDMNIEQYPAQLIKPANGELRWFLDNEAAALVIES